MTKVKVAYGIFSGERTGSRLRRALRNAGYEVVRNAADADIIMAHSAGRFWTTEATVDQKLMLIDPPYWPGKTVRERSQSQRRANLSFRRYGYPFGRWLVRNLWGMYYAVRDLPRTVRIIRRVFTFDLEDIIRRHNHILLVHNEHDTWLTPDFAALKRLNRTLKTIEAPGNHEDITHHPEHYVDLLRSLP